MNKPISVIVFERVLKQETTYLLRDHFGFKQITQEQAQFFVHACEIPAKIVIAEVVEQK